MGGSFCVVRRRRGDLAVCCNAQPQHLSLCLHTPSLIQQTTVGPPMIRRTPTLIPMGDFDVQDARDLLAKQKAEAAQHQQLVAKMKRIAQNPNMDKEDYEVMDFLKTALARQEKARRLGLQPGRSYSLFTAFLYLKRLPQSRRNPRSILIIQT